jgi:hypothetical protein
MLVVADNDVIGAVTAMRRILESEDWAEYLSDLGARFTTFGELGLSSDAPDRVVWLTCQNADALLITANRAGDVDSLDRTIRELSEPTSLPVVTIADPQRVIRDSTYAEACALRVLEYLERIDSLRGVGRLFIP